MLTNEQVKEIKQVFNCVTARIIAPSTKLFLLIGVKRGRVEYEKIVSSGYTVEEVIKAAKDTLI